MGRISLIVLSFGILVFLIGVINMYYLETSLLGNLVYFIPGIIIIFISLLMKREKNQIGVFVAIALGIFVGIVAFTGVFSIYSQCLPISGKFAPGAVALIMAFFGLLIINKWKILPTVIYFGLAVFLLIVVYNMAILTTITPYGQGVILCH